MPTQKKRIALTVPDDINALLDKLANLTEVPKTRLIIDMLEEYAPILDRTISALESIKNDKQNSTQLAKKFAQELVLDATDKLGLIAREANKL